MRLSKERKIYVAVFGLGVVAFAVDRLFLGPSSAGAAGPADVAAESAATGPSPAGTDKPEVPAAPSFAKRLQERTVWQEGPMLDVFTPPESWVGAPAAAEASEPVAADTTFAEKHKLTNVWRNADGTRGLAVINGKCYSLDAEVDGYRLVDVEVSGPSQAAILEKDGVRLRLVMAGPAAPHKPDKPGK